MKREILVAASLFLTWSAAPAEAANPASEAFPNATEVAQLKQRNADRDEERLERHRDWEEDQQERREEERDNEDDRDDDFQDDWDDWENDDRDENWDDDDDWDRDWENNDRDENWNDSWDRDEDEDNDNWFDGWFWNLNNGTSAPSDDQRTLTPRFNAVQLELTSSTNDWVTVVIEGLNQEQLLSFNEPNVAQTIALPPGTYRISFRPTFSRNTWESGYLNLGQTDRIRIRFDQARDRVQVYDDPYAWTSEANSPLRLYSGNE